MGAWVTDNTSTKRHGAYITYAAVRAADGSVVLGLAWAAMARAGKGVKAGGPGSVTHFSKDQLLAAALVLAHKVH